MTNATTPSTTDVLTDARRLIQSPDTWTKNGLGVIDGELIDEVIAPDRIPDLEDCHAYCALGALIEAAVRRVRPLRGRGLLSEVEAQDLAWVLADESSSCLVEAMPGAYQRDLATAEAMWKFLVVAEFNDADAIEHSDVLAAFDRAIAA